MTYLPSLYKTIGSGQIEVAHMERKTCVMLYGIWMAIITNLAVSLLDNIDVLTL